MKIVYTYHCLQQRIGGISRYFFEIFQRIRKTDDVAVVSKYLNNLYFSEVIKGKKRDFLGDRKFLTKYYVRNFIEDFFMFLNLHKTEADVIHMTGESPWIFRFIHDKPIVVTVHDMIPELTNDSRRVGVRRKCIEKADAIICVSENTRNDLLRIYPDINREKIFVVYHGYENETYEEAVDVCQEEYILFVGNRGGYKNFNFMLKAIAPLLKERQLRLLCTGHELNAEEQAMIAQLGIDGLVKSVGFVSDAQLVSLYRNAQLFIFPSKYEGFGIPILESWANGCPLCLSNTSCFPEIAGDAAAYFDPENQQSVRLCVEKMLDDADFRSRIVANGRDRMKLFSWDIAAKKTRDVYMWAIEHYKNKTR